VGDERRVVQFGAPEETAYGFAQAVRVGSLVHVSGQIGRDGDERPIDMAGQMRIAYRRIARLLADLGLTMRDVVDETLFVTDMRAASAAAHTVRAEAYGEPIEVASTLIGVARIGSPDAAVPLLVEIKATAVAR
jgi:enamine deaminase RidA (YjgF/YER057c/UK114 family)